MYKLFPLIFIFSLLLVQASASGALVGVNHSVNFHIKVSGINYSFNEDGTWGLFGYLNVSDGHENISLMVENLSITPIVYLNYSLSLNNNVNSINYSLYLISTSSFLNSTPIREHGYINLVGVKDVQVYINKSMVLNNETFTNWVRANVYGILLIMLMLVLSFIAVRLENYE